MVARMSKRKVKLRKDLNADALFSRVRSDFEIISDFRSGLSRFPYPMHLCQLLPCFPLRIFLYLLGKRRSGDTNLKTAYKVDTVPCDAQMRTILVI